MFRPRGHWNEREKALLRRARWSTIGAFAIATCMHWTGGCSSTGERFEDGIVESETTLPEMGSGPSSLDGDRPILASEDSDAFRPEPLSDEPRTGREKKNLFAAAPKAAKGTDGALMDLDAALPADAAPLLVPSGKSSPLAAKLDEEKMKQDEARRAALVADNDRLLAEATASLGAPPKLAKAKKTHVAHHKAKKHPRVVRYAKHHGKKASRQLAQAVPAAQPTVERWKPTLPPMVAANDLKPAAPAAPVAAETKPNVVPPKYEAPQGLAAALSPVKPTNGASAAKKETKLASTEIGTAYARHVGVLLMGLGALVLLCLFFLRKSRRENEPMDW